MIGILIPTGDPIRDQIFRKVTYAHKLLQWIHKSGRKWEKNNTAVKEWRQCLWYWETDPQRSLGLRDGPTQKSGTERRTHGEVWKDRGPEWGCTDASDHQQWDGFHLASSGAPGCCGGLQSKETGGGGGSGLHTPSPYSILKCLKDPTRSIFVKLVLKPTSQTNKQ